MKINDTGNWVIRFYNSDGDMTAVSYEDNVTEEYVKSVVSKMSQSPETTGIFEVDYAPYFGTRETAPIPLKFKNNELHDAFVFHIEDIKERMRLGTYKSRKSISKPVVRETPKVGRNDPCSCGSGIKYKKCCGKD
jgi:uncharacterized protein YecA (UPF0149 family)